jgi:CHAP domain
MSRTRSKSWPIFATFQGGWIMSYPGRIIKIGESNAAIVNSIRTQLASKGYQIPAGSNGFDTILKSVVSVYQAQNVDTYRRPLRVDGEVGPMTWGSLFTASRSIPANTSIATAALNVAIGELGVREQPLGSNRGPKVDQYQIEAGLGSGGYYWCMAFIYWCFKTAATNTGATNPFPKTAGCLDAWNRVRNIAPNRLISRSRAISDPSLVKPGAVFILDYGSGMGHTGIVRRNRGGALITVEGNSNSNGSRNGLGVFELDRRSVTLQNLKGFIDFT